MSGADEALAAAESALSKSDSDAAVAHLSAAIRGYTDTGRPCDAAMACLRLGDLLANFLGNLTASRAWFRRAERLLADQPDCVEQGWVAVAAMGCEVDDPADLLARAELALDRARRFGDVNLETKALADAGLAHVQAGRIAHGMDLLDEAMGLVCGDADDLDVAGKSVCSFFTACYFATDFARAGSWADSLRQRGIIGTSAPAPLFLSSHCDSVQAALLMQLGRWGEAEALLEKASAEFEAALHIPSWHPSIALADLRVRQGRLADAEALLLGREAHMDALLPTTRLHLARGDLALAMATARRGVRLMGDDRLRVPELLAVCVEAALQQGDVEGARREVDTLIGRISDIPHPLWESQAGALRARVEEAEGNHAGAVASVQAAIADLAPGSAPLLHVSLLVQLASLYEHVGALDEAIVEARAAASLLRELDVVLDQQSATLLGRLGVLEGERRSNTAGQAMIDVSGRRCHVTHGDQIAVLPSTKGLRYLAALVSCPGVERHALDLVDGVEGVDREVDRRAIAGAGPGLDASARTAYRHRIEALRTEVDAALARGDDDAAMKQEEELDHYVAQLAAAFGLGGHARPTGSAAEKARVNVTRALRGAIAAIAAVLPPAGAALDRGVRTGIYCSYAPAAGDTRWIVQP